MARSRSGRPLHEPELHGAAATPKVDSWRACSRRPTEALKAAGAPDDKAREAAEEIAAYGNRLASIEADARLPKWMMGLVLAGVFSLVVKTFFT